VPALAASRDRTPPSDGYSDADAREEMIELENDTIDTLVNDSQDASTEGIDNGGWNHDD
jgi:N utilization substance protein A